MNYRLRWHRGIAIAVILILIVAAAVFYTGRLSEKVDQDHLQLLEETIRNYAVQCYALEGSYPEKIQYLEKNYTLDLNRDKYVYHYKFIGANMMPEIYVFKKEQ